MSDKMKSPFLHHTPILSVYYFKMGLIQLNLKFQKKKQIN